MKVKSHKRTRKNGVSVVRQHSRPIGLRKLSPEAQAKRKIKKAESLKKAKAFRDRLKKRAAKVKSYKVGSVPYKRAEAAKAVIKTNIKNAEAKSRARKKGGTGAALFGAHIARRVKK